MRPFVVAAWVLLAVCCGGARCQWDDGDSLDQPAPDEPVGTPAPLMPIFGSLVATSPRDGMALYELRTYTLQVGKMAEAVGIYQAYGWPAFQKVGGDKLIGYFMSDVGTLNQLVHLWKFEDDADRRRHWQAVYGSPDFQEFARRVRPLIQLQENKLLQAAPWGPHP